MPRRRTSEPKPTVAGCPICKRRDSDGHDSYCTPERRANAERDRLATDPPPPMVVRYGNPAPIFTERKEPPMTTATLERVTSNLGLPAPSTGDKPVEMATCKTCGPTPRENFATKMDGSPHAICRPCKGEAMRARRGGTVATAFPMSEPAATVTMPGAADFALDPEFANGSGLSGAVDNVGPAVVVDVPVAPPEAPASVRVEVPAPIDADIAECERRLADLQKVKELMASDPDDLRRLHRLVTEALQRKGAA